MRPSAGGNGRSSRDLPARRGAGRRRRRLDRERGHATGIGFGMRVLVYDPFLTAAPPVGIEQVDLPTLLRESRFVVLTAPATPDTRGMINAATLSQMRPDAYLVNVARGDLVVEGDLIAALRRRQLAGAGLDVSRSSRCRLTARCANLTSYSALTTGRIRARALSGHRSERWTSCSRSWRGRRRDPGVEGRRGHRVGWRYRAGDHDQARATRTPCDRSRSIRLPSGFR